jgi:hypothetical protein
MRLISSIPAAQIDGIAIQGRPVSTELVPLESTFPVFYKRQDFPGIAVLHHKSQMHHWAGLIATQGKKSLYILKNPASVIGAFNLLIGRGKVGINREMDGFKGVGRLIGTGSKSKQAASAGLGKNHGIGMNFKTSEKLVLGIGSKSILQKKLKLRVQGGLAKPVRA